MATSGLEQHPPDSEVAADQPGSNGLPNPGSKESEGKLNTPQNPSGSMPTEMNPHQPLMVSAPLPTLVSTPPVAGPGPMPDLSFDMGDMFGNGSGDFDFDPVHLWFDPTAVYDGGLFHRYPDMVETKPRFDPVRKNNPWFDPIVMHDGPSLDTT